MNAKYTYCPKCEERHLFHPNATYQCENCGKKFFVKIEDTKSYLTPEKFQRKSLFGQLPFLKKVFYILLLILAACLLIYGNLSKGVAATNDSPFSLDNIIKTGAFFLIGVPIVYYFKKKK